TLHEQKLIIDTNTKTRIAADGLTESLTTTRISDARVKQMRTKSTCTPDPSASHSSVLGYDVVQAIKTLPAGNHGFLCVELWVAPALDCYPLREIVYRSSGGGSEVLTNLREVTSVNPGPPAVDLFVVPRGYAERAPSAVFAEYDRRYAN